MGTKTLYSASIRPRPRADGTTAYDVRYRHEGKSRTLSFTTAKAADNWASILRKVGPVEALEFLNLATTDGTPTVADYAEKYISTKSGIEGRTADSYRTYMRLHIGPSLGHLPLDAVSSDAIAAWINLRAAEGAASKTIKNDHGFLSAMFQSAVDGGIIPRNPCSRSRLPESEHREMVFLSPDEFTNLLAYIPPRYLALVLTLASTGLRWGEATALRPEDFDLEARTVRVSRAWKSSRAQGWYIGPPKTRRSKRTVSMPEDLVALLVPLLEARTEYVFTNAFGKPVRQQNFHESVWAPARRLANGQQAFDKAKADPDQEWKARTNGVWDGRSPAKKPLGKMPRVHDLRHSHASWLIAAGVPIDVVSRRMGHESITTTVNIYGHIAEERLNRAGDAIGIVLSGAMPQLTR